MVHMVRNTLKYIASKDMQSFASDLKTMYNAVSEDEGQKARERIVEKWSAKYPASMKRRIGNRDAVVSIFKFSQDVRKIIYTTNAIESLHSSYQKLETPAQRVPKRPGSAESVISCNFWSNKKMDSADSQLDSDLRTNVHNVRRSPALLI